VIRSPWGVAVLVVASLLALSVPTRGDAQILGMGSDLPSVPERPILSVPYVSQTEALCGGAAVAMIMRYWGERGVYAEDFARYVDGSGRGIATDVLVRAAERDGWTPIAFEGDSSELREHHAHGRPLIVLIEVAPRRYHYVVVVGWRNGQVLYHDPAVGPDRQMSAERFDRAWQATGRWTLLLLPDPSTRDRLSHLPADDDGGATGGTVPTKAAAEDDCAAYLNRAIPLGKSGELAAAGRWLERAGAVCPEATLRLELAGIRFRQGRFNEAAELAETAAAALPEDGYAWELLAAARFRAGDPKGALDAWNRVGAPRVDLVKLDGLRQTRYPLVARQLGTRPNDTLTVDRLERAGRRLAALPTITASAVRYRPLVDGSVELEAAVVERPLVVDGWLSIVGAAARALPERELTASLASPLGNGALWTAGWRWWEGRPRVAFGVAAPGVLGMPGVFEVQGYWERQTYGAPNLEGTETGGSARVVEERRHGHVGFREWLTGDLRIGAFLSLDRWSGHRLRPGMAAEAEIRMAGDRSALQFVGAAWPAGRDGRPGFGGLGLGLRLRSASGRHRTEWSARAAVEMASAGAPLALWPGAGTGHARPALLRAHPILEAGVVRADRIGRLLVHGGGEMTRWVWDWGFSAAGLALFVDAASLAKPLGVDEGSGLQVDIGTGVRLTLPGRGRLRADLAVGLRDGSAAASLAWEAPWPNSVPVLAGSIGSH
jgi:hypothetical protein